MADSRPHPRAVVAIKSVHSAIFLGELAAILWLVITGIVGRRDRTVALAAAAVAGEAVVFCGNGRTCPLTPLTEHLGATRGAVSDIFLPDAVARTIPTWSTALVVLAVLLHVRSARQRADGVRHGWFLRTCGGSYSTGGTRFGSLMRGVG